MSKRRQRASLARDTLQILEQGHYTAPSGRTVHIERPQAEAQERTRLYTPDALAALYAEAQRELKDTLVQPTQVEVTGETTLEGGHRLWREGEQDMLVLNFASAKNPGGGFLGGSQAQEESLARSSGLYPCLLRQGAMYTYNRGRSTKLYSDHMIYSPQVPVLRQDDGALLEDPWRADFVTAPAVNAGEVRRQERKALPEVPEVMHRRVGYVLALAWRHQRPVLVLGAWGCGVFQNDPAQIAALFARHLGPGGDFHGVFSRILFAVLDRGKRQEILGAFQSALAGLS
jgi:uncharacterized protein (TIGR02452 family)